MNDVAMKWLPCPTCGAEVGEYAYEGVDEILAELLEQHRQSHHPTVDEIAARWAAAEPGPWPVRYESCDCGDGYPCSHPQYPTGISIPNRDDDTRFEPSEIGEMRDAELAAIEHAAVDVAALLAEVERLTRWKAEAITVLGDWEEVFEALGKPGRLGQSKAKASLTRVERLTAELAESGESVAEWVDLLDKCIDHFQPPEILAPIHASARAAIDGFRADGGGR